MGTPKTSISHPICGVFPPHPCGTDHATVGSGRVPFLPFPLHLVTPAPHHCGSIWCPKPRPSKGMTDRGKVALAPLCDPLPEGPLHCTPPDGLQCNLCSTLAPDPRWGHPSGHGSFLAALRSELLAPEGNRTQAGSGVRAPALLPSVSTLASVGSISLTLRKLLGSSMSPPTPAQAGHPQELPFPTLGGSPRMRCPLASACPVQSPGADLTGRESPRTLLGSGK